MNISTKEKETAAWAYIFMFFLIPYYKGKNSEFCRLHTNQGIVLTISYFLWLLYALLYYFLFKNLFSEYLLDLFLNFLVYLFLLLNLLMSLFGLYNVSLGKWKKLPLIGKITIYK